jgi:hypothetical protein
MANIHFGPCDEAEAFMHVEYLSIRGCAQQLAICKTTARLHDVTADLIRLFNRIILVLAWA